MVQVTYDTKVDDAFLETMRRHRVRELPSTYGPMKLILDHSACGKDLRRVESEDLRSLEMAHARKVRIQWCRVAGASSLRVTRAHFTNLAGKEDRARKRRGAAGRSKEPVRDQGPPQQGSATGKRTRKRNKRRIKWNHRRRKETRLNETKQIQFGAVSDATGECKATKGRGRRIYHG